MDTLCEAPCEAFGISPQSGMALLTPDLGFGGSIKNYSTFGAHNFSWNNCFTGGSD